MRKIFILTMLCIIRLGTMAQTPDTPCSPLLIADETDKLVEGETIHFTTVPNIPLGCELDTSGTPIYTWFYANVAQSAIKLNRVSISNAIAGEYYVTVRLQQKKGTKIICPCVGNSEPSNKIIVVSRPQKPKISTQNVICGESSSFTVTSTVTGELIWRNESLDKIVQIGNVFECPPLTVDTWFSVSERINGVKGDSTAFEVKVTQLPKPVAVNKTVIVNCYNETATLQVQPVNNYLVKWKDANNNVLGEGIVLNPIIANLNSTYYKAVTYNSVCESLSEDVTVTVTPLTNPTISFPHQICQNGVALLTSTPGNNETIKWFNQNKAFIGESDNIQISVKQNDTIFYARRIKGTCQSDTTALKLHIIAKPATLIIKAIGDDCFGNQATLTASNVQGSQVNWYDDPNCNPQNLLFVGNSLILQNISVQNNIDYYAVPTNGQCVGETSKYSVKANKLPDVAIVNTKPLKLMQGESTQLVSSSDGSKYEWTSSLPLDNAFISSPVLLAKDTGDFQVQLKVTDINGCINTDNIQIEVKARKELEIYNFYVPDYGEPWKIGYIDNIPNCEVIIYDIDGRKVFYSNNYKNEPWYGKYNSNQEKLANGAYYFYILEEKKVLAKGAVTIMNPK